MLLVALVPASTKTAVVHGGTSETSQGRHQRPAHQRRIATTSCDGETGMRGPEVAAPRDEAFTSRDRPARAVRRAGIPTRLIDAGAESDWPEMRPLHSSKHFIPHSDQRAYLSAHCRYTMSRWASHDLSLLPVQRSLNPPTRRYRRERQEQS